MKATTRLHLIERISADLQSRYTFNDIDDFLGAHGIADLPERNGSKRVYSKMALKPASNRTIREIADELQITVADQERPDKWKDTNHIRMFISHLAEHKGEATRLQQCVFRYAIDGFVAHQDIAPTREWQIEIERALATMELFVSMHRPGFSNSYWTQQEVGYAVARGVLVIPLMMGEEPSGFIYKHQGLIRDRQHRAEDIAEKINDILTDSEFAERLLYAQMPF